MRLALPLLAGLLLLPTAAWPCSMAVPRPWTTQIGKQGRVVFDPSARALQGFFEGKVVWSLESYAMHPSELVVSPDSRHLALVGVPKEGAIRILTVSGEAIADWDLFAALTNSERQTSTQGCGNDWVSSIAFVQGALEVTVPVNGRRMPMYGQPPGLKLRFELETRKAARVEPPRATVEEVVRGFDAASSQEEREAAFFRLWRRSIDEKDPALAEFWWRVLQRPEGCEISLAVQAFAAVAPAKHLARALELPAHRERDQAVFRELSERSPQLLTPWAVAALEQGRDPPGLRRIAVDHLGRSQDPQLAWRAIDLGFSDPAGEVVTAGWSALGRRPNDARRLAAVMKMMDSQDDMVRWQARMTLRQSLEAPAATAGRDLVELLQRAHREGRFARAPEVLVILGAIEHASGNREHAAELYQRGRSGLLGEDKIRLGLLGNFLNEATLQLAWMAKERGDRKTADELAAEILASAQRSFGAWAPAPIPLRALSPNGKGGWPKRSAEDVARELVSGGKGPGAR